MTAVHDRQWQVGGATVTAIVEAETAGIPPSLFFPDATADDIRSTTWLEHGYAAGDGSISFRVQAFVIDFDGHVTVVDPCVGNHKQRDLPFWNDLHTTWLEQFVAAGYNRHHVDQVVHTHLHEDHIGWDTHLTEHGWAPTFPNARHIYVDAELDYWTNAARTTGRGSYDDSISPVVDAGLAVIVAADADLGGGIRLIPTPGHTPGHVALEVSAGAENFVITGDLLHHPAQFAHPDWAEIADWNADLARRTRSEFFDLHASRGTLLAGTHFPTRPVGRIAMADGSWVWIAEQGTDITP